MNGLKEYQRRRLDLADMLRAALHIARAYTDDEREQEARQLLARLSAGRPRAACRQRHPFLPGRADEIPGHGEGEDFAAKRCGPREVARLTSQAPADAGAAALCLRHVALVLNARPAPGRGQAMVLALAGALRRAAEDMRAYSLKREARHSGLVTDDESRAHCDALRLLAGQQALARPWDGGPATGSKEA